MKDPWITPKKGEPISTKRNSSKELFACSKTPRQKENKENIFETPKKVDNTFAVPLSAAPTPRSRKCKSVKPTRRSRSPLMGRQLQQLVEGKGLCLLDICCLFIIFMFFFVVVVLYPHFSPNWSKMPQPWPSFFIFSLFRITLSFVNTPYCFSKMIWGNSREIWLLLTADWNSLVGLFCCCLSPKPALVECTYKRKGSSYDHFFVGMIQSHFIQCVFSKPVQLHLSMNWLIFLCSFKSLYFADSFWWRPRPQVCSKLISGLIIESNHSIFSHPFSMKDFFI